MERTRPSSRCKHPLKRTVQTITLALLFLAVLHGIWFLRSVTVTISKLYSHHQTVKKDVLNSFMVQEWIKDSNFTATTKSYRFLITKFTSDDLIQGSDEFPKIIHRMWKNSNINTIPSEWQSTLDYCRILNKDYRQVLWTDETMRELIATHYSWFLPHYDSYPYHIQRVDAARYFILHRHGGIYLDLDVGCKKSLEPLRIALNYTERGAMLPMTDPFGFSNDVMFSSRGHPFFEQVIRSLPDKSGLWYLSPYLTVMCSTGPIFLSLVHRQLYESGRGTSVVALSQELYTHGKSSFFRHNDGNSWHQWDATFIFFICHHFISVTVTVSTILFLIIRRQRNKKRIRSNNINKDTNTIDNIALKIQQRIIGRSQESTLPNFRNNHTETEKSL